ncbi:MAG TPA: hypothetical protein VIU12_04685 [Chryseolinea sp.]
MINERIAIIMLEEKTPCLHGDPHYTKQFYKSIRLFALASLQLCEEEKYHKLEQFMKIAFKLFQEGNDTVKSGIVNVYLYTLLFRWITANPAAKASSLSCPMNSGWSTPRQHYASGM